MPAKSKSQWRAMWAKYRRGEISREELDDWIEGVSYKRLPERKRKKRRGR